MLFHLHHCSWQSKLPFWQTPIIVRFTKWHILLIIFSLPQCWQIGGKFVVADEGTNLKPHRLTTAIELIVLSVLYRANGAKCHTKWPTAKTSVPKWWTSAKSKAEYRQTLFGCLRRLSVQSMWSMVYQLWLLTSGKQCQRWNSIKIYYARV